MSAMEFATISHFFCIFNKVVANSSFLVLQMQILGIYCSLLKPEHTPDALVMIERSPSHEF